MDIEFFGDLSCPWCHLGWRRLKQAVALRPAHGIIIHWRPFQLNPDIPVTGIDRQDYLLRKFGNLERVREVQTAIDNAMRADGIAINLERVHVTPHTYLAHRLMLLAESHNRLDEAMTAFFMAYFVEGRNIGDPQVLEEIAATAGLPASEAEKVLNSLTYSESLSESEAISRQLGIKAVPYFLFERQYSLAGAHDPVAFLPIIDLCRLNPPIDTTSIA